MFSNLKQVTTLVLLASAASIVFAAPAPVSNLSARANPSAAQSAPVSVGAETDIARLERLLENRNRIQIRMQQQLDEMTLEINELRGQLERNTHEMQQMLQRQRDLFVELDALRSQSRAAPAEASASEAEATSVPFNHDLNEQAAYQSAVDLILKQRDYDAAISALEKFQADYPDSTLAANAHYWLGQLHFAKRQDQQSAKSFAAVLSYPDSNKRADALVKLGDIAARNNNPTQAKKFYQQVIDEHPNTSSARAAQAKLK